MYKRQTEILEHLKKNDAVQSVVTMVGYDTMSGDVRSNASTFILKLKHWDDRKETAEEIQKDLQKYVASHPDIKGVAALPAAIKGLGSTNGFSGYILSHGNDNPLVLQNVAENFLDALQDRPELTGLRSYLTADTPQLKLYVDQTKAIALGVDVDDIYDTISHLTVSYTHLDVYKRQIHYQPKRQNLRGLPSDQQIHWEPTDPYHPSSQALSLPQIMPDENRRGGYVNGNVNGNVKGGFNRSRRNYRKKREG